jgi:hypothetical protein
VIGLSTIGPRELSSNVYPSGSALITDCTPSNPDAPALFSTTTGTFNRSESFSPTRRAATSEAFPGGNGTTIWIALVGYSAPSAGPPAVNAAATDKASNWRRDMVVTIKGSSCFLLAVKTS